MNTDWRNNKDWRKSTFSGGGNDCIYVRGSLDGLRDSKDARGPVLGVSPQALSALVRSVA